MWYCHYQIGHRLLFRARELIGKSSIGAALNGVIVSKALTGRAASDKAILAALRARAASGQTTELDRPDGSTAQI